MRPAEHVCEDWHGLIARPHERSCSCVVPSQGEDGEELEGERRRVELVVETEEVGQGF